MRAVETVHAVHVPRSRRAGPSHVVIHVGEEEDAERESLHRPPRLLEEGTEIGRVIEAINRDRKVTVLLVEQNARMALSISRTTYVMETGTIVLEGPSATLRESPHVKVAYLGG